MGSSSSSRNQRTLRGHENEHKVTFIIFSCCDFFRVEQVFLRYKLSFHSDRECSHGALLWCGVTLNLNAIGGISVSSEKKTPDKGPYLQILTMEEDMDTITINLNIENGKLKSGTVQQAAPIISDPKQGAFKGGCGNSGNWNSGHENSGHRNSGCGNSGDGNSGHGNSGNWNSGYGNSTNRETGIFCNEPGSIRAFNKPTNLKFEEIDHPSLAEFDINEWVPEDRMTNEEKIANPKFFTTKGYLKRLEFKEAWNRFWERTSAANKQKFFMLPNFDAEIFYQITGIVVSK